MSANQHRILSMNPKDWSKDDEKFFYDIVQPMFTRNMTLREQELVSTQEMRMIRIKSLFSLINSKIHELKKIMSSPTKSTVLYGKTLYPEWINYLIENNVLIKQCTDCCGTGICWISMFTGKVVDFHANHDNIDQDWDTCRQCEEYGFVAI